MTRRLKPPIYTKTQRGETRWVLNVGDDERAVIVQLLGELRMLLDDANDPDTSPSPLVQRLFPTAYPDDPDKEAEYQRLMREDLVASRLVQIDAVLEAFDADRATIGEAEAVALMQSVNAVRVVLGTMLDVTEDDDVPDSDDGDEESPDDIEPERQLYVYLSWFLDWIVRSLNS